MLSPYHTRNIWRRVCPGISACTLRVRSSADQSAFTSYSLYHARQEPLSRVDVPLGGNLITDETAPWLIWQDDLDAAGAPVPKIGDEISQSVAGVTVVWEITAVDTELFGQPYVCSALRRAIS